MPDQPKRSEEAKLADKIMTQKPRRRISNISKKVKDRFSTKQLVVFGLLFAVFGIVIVFRSFASSPPISTNSPEASYNTSDFYGVAIPSSMLPAATLTKSSFNSPATTKVSTQVSAAGSDWVRIDAGPALQKQFFANSEVDEKGNLCPAGILCDVNRLSGKKVLAIIDHNTMNDAGGGEITGCEDLKYYDPKSFTLQQWGHVVDCVSKRLKGKVSAYEIWNEPTLQQFQLGYQDGSPQHYFDMLKTAHDVIRLNDPGARVVGLGGVELYVGKADDPDGKRLQASKDFSKEVRLLGGLQYVDAISVHAYSWDSCDTAVFNAYEAGLQDYQKTWPGKEIWITETGQRSTQPTEPTCTQSKYIQYAYSSFINSGVKKVFVFALYDAPDGSFGMYDPSGSPKAIRDYLAKFVQTPKTGLLRVETSPAIAARLAAHPGFVRNGRVNAESLAQGRYTLRFASSGNITAKLPSETNIDIEEKKLTEVTVDTSSGTTSIVSKPNAALSAATGQLTVKTLSGVSIGTAVHPGFVRTWGVDWEQVHAGDYTIRFSDPSKTAAVDGAAKTNGANVSRGVTVPPETNISVLAGTTTVVKVDTASGVVTTSYVDNATVSKGDALLRVETVPATKLDISVHPGIVRTWGVEWDTLLKGPYTLTTSYEPSSANGQAVRLPVEFNFEQKAFKTTSIKVNVLTGLPTIDYIWQAYMGNNKIPFAR